jgi:MFS family permease
MSTADPRAGSGRRLFLWALVASLSVTAVIAIATLLFAEFDDTAGRILATTALLSLACLLSLSAGVLLDQRRAVPLAWGTIAASGAGFVIAMAAIWGDPGNETLSRITWTLWLGAGAGAQAATVTALLRPGASRRLRVLRALSILLASSLAALIAVAIWTEPDSDAFARAMGALAIGAVLTSLLQPILQRIEQPAPTRARLVLDLDREPSDEAVDAAIGALAQHGVKAERR